MPPSAELTTRLALVAPSLRVAASRLWSGPDPLARYERYLVTMHGVVRASVPLMTEAAELCAELGSVDRSMLLLADYLRRHAVEELDHDDWLADDLAVVRRHTAGEGAVAPLDQQPVPAVARMVGAQYYWIRHHHPVSLLGYIAVLEANAPGPGLATALAELTGLPGEAMRTVAEHAALDGGHVAEVFDLIDRLRLPRRLTEAVACSALATAESLVDVFAAIARRTPWNATSSPSSKPTAFRSRPSRTSSWTSSVG